MIKKRLVKNSTLVVKEDVGIFSKYFVNPKLILDKMSF
jgi:hypothetical protein